MMGIRLTTSSMTMAMAIFAAALFGAATAQGEPYLFPSLALTEIYDDNLFFRPDNQVEDRYLRLRPAVRLGYRTLATDFSLNLSTDLERYNRTQDLDSNRARRAADLNYSLRPNRVLTLQANASYIKTRTPRELVALTGLEYGRVFAERRFFSPSLQYEYDNLTTFSGRYEYIRDKISDGIGSDVNTVALGMDRRLARHNTANFRYRFDRFHFDTGQSVNIHALLVGGNYRFTPRLTINVLAGPRFTDSDTDASVLASLLYQIERGELGFNYQREQTTVLGVGAAVTTTSVGVTLALMPVPDVELRAVPNYAVTTNNGLRAETYRFTLEAGWQLTRYFTAVGSYQFAAQHGNLLSPGGNEITHNVVMIGVVIAAPQRFEQETRRRIYLPSSLGGEPSPIPGQLREAPSFEEE